jgi:hypothetical protein
MPIDHYLPEWYLSGFGFKGLKGRIQIYQYQRNSTPPILSTPKRLAKIKNYDRVRGPQPRSITDILSESESLAAAIVRKLANDRCQLNWDERRFLGFYIAVQQFRVPATRESIEGSFGKEIDQFTKDQAFSPGVLEESLARLQHADDKPSNVTADSIRQALLIPGAMQIWVGPETSFYYMGIGIKMLYNQYARMQWRVFASGSAEESFITSDMPVSWHDPETRIGDLTDCVCSDGLEIGFPLTKNKFLLLTHDHERIEKWSIMKKTGQTEAEKKIWDELPEILFNNADQYLIDEMNRRTIIRADRYFYSAKLNDKLDQIFVGKPKGPTFKVSLHESLRIQYLSED